jgi:hypothetical protein
MELSRREGRFVPLRNQSRNRPRPTGPLSGRTGISSHLLVTGANCCLPARHRASCRRLVPAGEIDLLLNVVVVGRDRVADVTLEAGEDDVGLVVVAEHGRDISGVG